MRLYNIKDWLTEIKDTFQFLSGMRPRIKKVYQYDFPGAFQFLSGMRHLVDYSHLTSLQRFFQFLSGMRLQISLLEHILFVQMLSIPFWDATQEELKILVNKALNLSIPFWDAT